MLRSWLKECIALRKESSMPTFFWPNVLPNTKHKVPNIQKIFPLGRVVTDLSSVIFVVRH
jgi:hypothetical protein